MFFYCTANHKVLDIIFLLLKRLNKKTNKQKQTNKQTNKKPKQSVLAWWENLSFLFVPVSHWYLCLYSKKNMSNCAGCKKDLRMSTGIFLN